MASTGSRGLNTVAMVLAFVIMGGFLYWLSIASAPGELAVAVEEEPQAQPVGFSTFALNPPMYEGTLIEVSGVPVFRPAGDRSFIVSLPDSALFWVELAPAAMVMGAPIAPEVTVRMVGTVHSTTEVELASWTADSLFVDEAERESVTARGTFFLADELEATAPSGMGAMDEPATAQP